MSQEITGPDDFSAQDWQELYEIKEQVDQTAEQTGIPRRDILKGAGLLAAGSLAGGISAQQAIERFVQEAEAQASTSDSDGNVGTPSDRVDVFADGVDATSASIEDIENGNWYDNPVVDPDTTDWGQALTDAVSSASSGETVYVPPASWDLLTTPRLSADVTIQGAWTDWPTGVPQIFTESNSFVIDSDPGVNISLTGLRVTQGSQTSSAEAAFRFQGQSHAKGLIVEGYPSGAAVYFRQDGIGVNKSKARAIVGYDLNSVARVNKVSGASLDTNAIEARYLNANNCTYAVRNNSGFGNRYHVQHHSDGTAVYQFNEASGEPNYGQISYAGDGVEYLAEVDAKRDGIEYIHGSVSTDLVNHINGQFVATERANNGTRHFAYGGALPMEVVDQDIDGGTYDYGTSRTSLDRAQVTDGVSTTSTGILSTSSEAATGESGSTLVFGRSDTGTAVFLDRVDFLRIGPTVSQTELATADGPPTRSYGYDGANQEITLSLASGTFNITTKASVLGPQS
jgi:hypothetical protein